MSERVTKFKVRKKIKIRNRYKQALYLTQDITWESDINTIKHPKQGCNEQTRKHDKHENDPQKKSHIGDHFFQLVEFILSLLKSRLR